MRKHLAVIGYINLLCITVNPGCTRTFSNLDGHGLFVSKNE